MKASKKSASATQRVLIYGPPKTGKTQLALELAKYFDIIFVDLENGHDPIYKLSQECQERTEIISLPDTRDYPIAIETCLKIVKGKVSICELHGKVRCMLCAKEKADIVEVDVNSMPNSSIIIFDSLTQLTSSAISHITKAEKEDYKVDWDDWGNQGKLLDTFLSHLQQARYNVICITHEIEIERDDKKRIIVPLCGTRNFSKTSAKYFSHVVYADRVNSKHTFSSSTSFKSNILTGSRTDVVMEGDEAQTLLGIFDPKKYKEVFGKEVNKINSTGLTLKSKAGSTATSPSAVLERLKSKLPKK